MNVPLITGFLLVAAVAAGCGGGQDARQAKAAAFAPSSAVEVSTPEGTVWIDGDYVYAHGECAKWNAIEHRHGLKALVGRQPASGTKFADFGVICTDAK